MNILPSFSLLSNLPSGKYTIRQRLNKLKGLFHKKTPKTYHYLVSIASMANTVQKKRWEIGDLLSRR